MTPVCGSVVRTVDPPSSIITAAAAAAKVALCAGGQEAGTPHACHCCCQPHCTLSHTLPLITLCHGRGCGLGVGAVPGARTPLVLVWAL